MSAPYQLLARLRPEEYSALKKDIEMRGVMVPVEVDQRGSILDGHHRAEIASSLGLRYRTITRRFESEQEKIEHVLKMNLLRRHLGPIAWAAAFRQLCKARGVRLGQGKRNDLTSASAAEVAKELGVNARTARSRLRLARDLRGHRDLADRVDAGSMEAKRALREARSRNARTEAARTPAPRLPASVRIEHIDFRKLDLKPASVDLIFCDPPYTKEFLPIWSDLSAFAARVLKPGRLLVCYAGQWALPELLDRLREHLTYVWIGSVHHRAYQHYQFQAAKVYAHSKPILLFSNGRYKPRGWVADSVIGSGAEKDLHPWQQSEGEAEHFISALTKPGELVVDPFLGSGTTAVAAKNLGRRFVGCDVDRSAVRIAKKRVSE